MPQSWQIKQARGFQTQGVWSLDPDFTVGAATIESHTDSLADILGAATTSEGYKNLLDTADGTLRAEYAFFKSMNIAVAARLDSEVPDDDPLQIDIDQLRIDAVSRAAVEERTLKTAAAWIKINAARAAEDPAKPPVAVRGSLSAAFQTRWLALPVKRQAREQAAGVWRTGSSQLRAADKPWTASTRIGIRHGKANTRPAPRKVTPWRGSIPRTGRTCRRFWKSRASSRKASRCG